MASPSLTRHHLPRCQHGSAECQRKKWKFDGHKQACREAGQIQIGDVMLLPDHRLGCLLRRLSNALVDRWLLNLSRRHGDRRQRRPATTERNTGKGMCFAWDTERCPTVFSTHASAEGDNETA